MRVLISCGGTGGHIYPAIAVADKIKEKYSEAEILFIGTRNGMENKLVPAAGYNIEGIDAKGLNRHNILDNIKTVKNMIDGGHQADEIIKEFKPDVALGTGAYVTGIVLTRAHKAGVSCCIHEQNALPGLTNKLLSRFAEKVFVSFSGTEKSFRHPERVIFTGNPIRSDFFKLDESECRKELGLADTDIMILVTGGSLGAEVLNSQVLKFAAAAMMPGLKIFFVTGNRYYDNIIKSQPKGPLTILGYANNMPVLMKAADLIISRAGAVAVSEITACGKPSVLIPSPNVSNNHQYYNAKAIADSGAAVLLQEKDLQKDEALFTDEVLSLLARPESLASMSLNAKALSRPDASDKICSELYTMKTEYGK